MKEVFRDTDPRSDRTVFHDGDVFYTIMKEDTGAESIPTQVGTINAWQVIGWKFPAVVSSDTGRRLYRRSDSDGHYFWRTETGLEYRSRLCEQEADKKKRPPIEEERSRLLAEEVAHHEANMRAEMKRFSREMQRIQDLYRLRTETPSDPALG